MTKFRLKIGIKEEISMKEYDKLVRDKIPEIIEEDGKEYETDELNDEEYKEYLKDKLLEETQEYIRSGDTEELADVLEVVRSILEVEDIKFEKLEEIRREKAEERGRFEKKIKLVKVYD